MSKARMVASTGERLGLVGGLVLAAAIILFVVSGAFPAGAERVNGFLADLLGSDDDPYRVDPYDPMYPLAEFSATYPIPLLLGMLGLISTPAGGVLLLVGRRMQQRRSWLRQHGQEAWGEVTRVVLDPNFRISNRSPFVLHATWEDPRTGQFYAAKSDLFWEDLSPRFPEQSRVRVLFDPDNPKHNLVDPDADPAHS